MTRNRPSAMPATPKIPARSSHATAKAMAKVRAALQPAPPKPSEASLKAPSGKLGTLLERVGRPTGATIDELAKETGWQAHTIRAAFCRLRQRGYPIAHEVIAEGRKAYRLDQKAG